MFFYELKKVRTKTIQPNYFVFHLIINPICSYRESEMIKKKLICSVVVNDFRGSKTIFDQMTAVKFHNIKKCVSGIQIF